jgi:hypothetical protein
MKFFKGLEGKINRSKIIRDIKETIASISDGTYC